jgi:hypothetical protein
MPCGVGDWAVALRSPDGTVLARVCPFDPAYSARADALRTGHPVYRPGEQYRRNPCPQKGLGARRRMTTRWSARHQRPMLQAAPQRQIGRLSQAHILAAAICAR